MDHQLARLHDLGQLILPVPVHYHFGTVDSRRQVVSGGAVHVDYRSLAVRSKPIGDNSLSRAVWDKKGWEAVLVEGNDCGGKRLLSFGSESASIHDRYLGTGLARVWKRMFGMGKGKVHAGGLANQAHEPGEAFVKQGQQYARSHGASRILAIHQECQQVEGSLAVSIIGNAFLKLVEHTL